MALVNMLAGGLAGMTVDLVLFPLDTLKTRLQMRQQAAAGGVAASAAVPRPAARSFYRGLAAAMAGSFPAAATFWTAYQAAKDVLTPLAPVGHVYLAHGGAAAAADVAVAAVRTPFEVVKQQLQAGLHADARACLAAILRRDGVRGLYAGYASTVAREVPFDVIEFALYEAIKSKLLAFRREASLTTPESPAARRGSAAPPLPSTPLDLQMWENAVAGSLAGGVAAGITTPLDVVKTRLMTQVGSAGAGGAARYTGWADCMRRVAAEEGLRGLFAGLAPRVAWISIGGAIFFGTFEELRRRLDGAYSGRTGAADGGKATGGPNTLQPGEAGLDRRSVPETAGAERAAAGG